MADEARKLLILGTGGNCLDILDIVLDINQAVGRVVWEPLGFLDDDPARRGYEFQGLKVLGPLAAVRDLPDSRLISGIGSPFNHRDKPAILAKTGAGPEGFATLVHPTATLSRWASLGAGCVLFPQVAVHSGARLGDQVIVLTGGVINHDCLVGDYSCLASGVRLSGGVEVGSCCYLGSASAVRGNLKIGPGSLVGLGSAVVSDVPPDSVVAGNPARPLRSNAAPGRQGPRQPF